MVLRSTGSWARRNGQYAKKWDAFISHAVEDQASFLRDLAAMLTRLGASIWCAETAREIGDSLISAIDTLKGSTPRSSKCFQD
jgi:hypothetical protein